MRNPAAILDDDFGYDAPARKKAPRKPRAGASGKKKKKSRRFNISAHQVARYGAIGMSATVAIGIMVNALMMQKGRHPAPLFGKGTVPIDTVVAAAPTASAASAPIKQMAVPPDDAPAPADAIKANRVASAPRDVVGTSGDDPIGRLLSGSALQSAPEKANGKTVLGVQKALAKLGFGIKANGTFGPATKKAIEAFEKDRHLPVKGEVSHRVVKVLAAESGIHIE